MLLFSPLPLTHSIIPDLFLHVWKRVWGFSFILIYLNKYFIVKKTAGPNCSLPHGIYINSFFFLLKMLQKPGCSFYFDLLFTCWWIKKPVSVAVFCFPLVFGSNWGEMHMICDHSWHNLNSHCVFYRYHC